MQAMASTKEPNTDASHHATAIARWEEEGGATNVSPRRAKPDLKQQKTLGAPLANDSKQEDSKMFEEEVMSEFRRASTIAGWFVPPIVIPIVFAVIIVAWVLYVLYS
jgi:hypothetical protein